MSEKCCYRCHTTKPVGDFNAAAKNRDGLSSWCKQCFRERAREVYIRHPRPVLSADERAQRRKASNKKFYDQPGMKDQRANKRRNLLLTDPGYAARQRKSSREINARKRLERRNGEPPRKQMFLSADEHAVIIAMRSSK